MIQTRKIVKIDEDKCDGCGACVLNCAEGAIRVVDGKARVVSDSLCDGLGACLGTCPRGALTIEERPAEAFDPAAAEAAAPAGGAKAPEPSGPDEPLACGCPGTMMRTLDRSPATGADEAARPRAARASRLGQWPVQLALLPPAGDIWQDAEVLIAADCAAYAMGDFHDRLLDGRTLAVACPKLDDTRPYVEKLAAVFRGNDVRRVTVARMEVPCCGGLETTVREALRRAEKPIPLDVVVVNVGGRVQRVNGVKVS
jgi:Pyruvate/2-oxoacid:ferredoxin oxidoreductase delta subunit